MSNASRLRSTGMTDADGVEIRCGDRCNLNYGIPPTNFRFTVVEIPGGLGFEGTGGNPPSGPMSDLCDCLHDIHVIGNIHERITTEETS